MRKQFVKTENYSRFAAGIQAVEQRGAKEAGMMLVHGAPGFGKSKVVSRWAVENGAAFLRANVDWTPKYFLVELAKVKAVSVDHTGTAQQLFQRLLDRLSGAQIPIVIDEAEFTLNQGAAALEKVRDLSDRTETTVVLIGMERIQQRIARHKQIASRIAQVVEFTPATLADVELACRQLSEVAMSPALMTEVHRLSGGRMRETLNVIAAVERIAAINGLESADVTDMEGAALSFDWQTRTPKGVRTGGR